MDELSKRRAFKAENSRLWAPVDALEYLISEIKNGSIVMDKIIIHYLTGDGEVNRPGYVCAGKHVSM